MKVALVGSAPSSNRLAPFGDPSWQIWACSPDNMHVLPRVDLWVELHGDLGWPEYQDWAVPYLAWLNAQTFPVLAIDNTFIPRAAAFPKDEMLRLFGCFHFTSSFAWMMALALARGATEIALFGIDMATDQEYKDQRKNFQHFIQIAADRGVKIMAPNESDILQPPPLYGYDRITAFTRKLIVRKNEITARIEAMRRQRDELNGHITHLSGALDDLDYVLTVWTGERDADDDRRHTERISVPQSRATNGVRPPADDLHGDHVTNG